MTRARIGGTIAAIGLLAVAVTTTAAERPLPGSVAARADSLMRDLVQRELFQGAVVLAHGERVVYEAGFGHADRERQVPFTPDTPTDAASIAKTFTAAGVLLLAAEGKVDLEAPVRAVLPEFPHPETRVRHLLSHSAGLPDYAWFDERVPPGQPRTNAGHLALVAAAGIAPRFGPGTAFAYDNAAYDVAAMVIERASASSYAGFIAKRFLGPLAIEAFVRPARFADWPGARTRGYRRTADSLADHDAYDLEGFQGAANIYASARSLQRWAAGFRQVMGPDCHRAAVSRARLDDGRVTGISLGSWYVDAAGSKRYYTGSHNGFHSIAYADDASGLSLSWVANDAPPAWLQSALSRALIAIAEGREPEALVPPASQEVAEPSGVYEVPSVGKVRVRRQGKAVQVERAGVTYDAYRIERGVHYVPGLDAYLRFAADPKRGVSLSWDSVFQYAPEVRRRR